MSWVEDQKWEQDWWGNCTNTLSEELKQLSYFKRLGLTETKNSKWRFAYDMKARTILDIGGGPCSFLLKCVNVFGVVTDPCHYPDWVYKRYEHAGIKFNLLKGEDITLFNRREPWDEIWIYNVLQHVENPQKIIENAKRVGKLIRFFDWIDAGVHPGHPHNLTQEQLDEWLGGTGSIEYIDENDAKGWCYYGVFPQ